jgi:hypothetical protein
MPFFPETHNQLVLAEWAVGQAIRHGRGPEQEARE